MNRVAIVASLQRLCLVVWVGGGLFFASVLTPVVFRVLADRHAAGLIVGASLRALHGIGLVCGVLLLALEALSFRDQRRGSKAVYSVGIVSVMLVLTAYSQGVVLPRMAPLRSVGTASQQFQALHRRSVLLETGVLLLGLVLVLRPEPVNLNVGQQG